LTNKQTAIMQNSTPPKVAATIKLSLNNLTILNDEQS